MNHSVLNLLKPGRPLVIGHRGYCARAPENTLPSFDLGLAAGADLVELDYHLSKDGVPVVIHDAALNRTTNARKIWRRSGMKVSQRTAAELQTLDAGGWFDAKFAGTKIPLLTEALDFIHSRGGMALIERKAGDPETLVRLLRERNLINQVVVISFDWFFLRKFHLLEPGQLLGALGPPERLANGRKASRIARRLSAARLAGIVEAGAKIAVWNRQITKAGVQLAHQRGLKVWVYTANEAGAAMRLRNLGVDGIITNEVSLTQMALSKPSADSKAGC
jgi:glycerophosphoryl diester phosphodiesterase